jgi:putative serine protease PepD
MTRPSRTALLAAAAVGIAAAGLGAGAGLYSALAPATTTVVERAAPSDATEAAASSAPLTVGGVYDRAHRGVVDVAVTVDEDEYSPFSRRGRSTGGSGFVFDDEGHVITNQHVVENRGTIEVTLWNGNSYPGRVIGMDRSTDLAVIKVSAPASELHPLELADSDEVRVGDAVVAIGSPFGLTGSITSGIVSALDRQMESPTNFTIGGSIQTDAAINHGNSGGPLLDMQARVIGVNTQIQSEGGGNDGVGFAVSSRTVIDVVPQLVAGKTVQHAYLGVGLDPRPASPVGVRLEQVVPGGPADRAGLQDGDVITKLDEQELRTTNDLSSFIDEHEPGDEVTATYVRDGDTDTLKVTLGTRPS